MMDQEGTEQDNQHPCLIGGSADNLKISILKMVPTILSYNLKLLLIQKICGGGEGVRQRGETA